MIYLDSAATSLIKPRSVGYAMQKALETMSSPGRGGYTAAMRAADTVLDCRIAACKLFNIDNPEKVIFTYNATHALNLAIFSLVDKGDKVVVSGYEHNSVIRPLKAIGADTVIAASELFKPEAAIESFRRKLPGAKAAVINHVSNVFGYILPVKEISGLCLAHGIPLIIDASQSAGSIDIDFDDLNAEYIAMPGHKGLMGPQGTGILLCRNSASPLLFGGTGSNSASADMPQNLPDRLEAGTHNANGIAGLLEGIRYITARKPEKILNHERKLLHIMAANLKQISKLRVFLSDDAGCQGGVMSVILEGVECEELASQLGMQGISVRAGLHCAPLAHKTAGTFDTGTVRFSLSPMNTAAEILMASDMAAHIFKKM